MQLGNCTNTELIAEVERRVNDPDRLDATYLWREMLRITSSMELCTLMINKGKKARRQQNGSNAR